MNMGYGFDRRDERESRRRERIRFIGSAIGLWALCATGIYLTGPGEPEAMPNALTASAATADEIRPSFGVDGQ